MRLTWDLEGGGEAFISKWLPPKPSAFIYRLNKYWCGYSQRPPTSGKGLALQKLTRGRPQVPPWEIKPVSLAPQWRIKTVADGWKKDRLFGMIHWWVGVRGKQTLAASNMNGSRCGRSICARRRPTRLVRATARACWTATPTTAEPLQLVGVNKMKTQWHV